MDTPDIVYPPVPMESIDLAIAIAQTKPGTEVYLDLPYDFRNKEGNPELGWGFCIKHGGGDLYFLKWTLSVHKRDVEISFRLHDGNIVLPDYVLGPATEMETWEQLMAEAMRSYVQEDFMTALNNYTDFKRVWPESMEGMDDLFKYVLEDALKEGN